MTLSESERQFVEDHNSAAMMTVGADGHAKVARVGVAIVDGKIWSSGRQDRVRTKRLQRDPRCTLFVYDVSSPLWLAIEARVTILDDPDAGALNVGLFRQMQGKPTGPLTWFGGVLEEGAFVQAMVEEVVSSMSLTPSARMESTNRWPESGRRRAEASAAAAASSSRRQRLIDTGESAVCESEHSDSTPRPRARPTL